MDIKVFENHAKSLNLSVRGWNAGDVSVADKFTRNSTFRMGSVLDGNSMLICYSCRIDSLICYSRKSDYKIEVQYYLDDKTGNMNISLEQFLDIDSTKLNQIVTHLMNVKQQRMEAIKTIKQMPKILKNQLTELMA